MKYINYCEECLAELHDISPSYFIFWATFVEDYIKGKLTNCRMGTPSQRYTKRMLRDLENNGFIISTETGSEQLRIKPLGINRSCCLNNHEIINVCLHAEDHAESELDENLIED